MKVKLPKHLRERKRYVRFKVLAESPVRCEEFEQSLWESALSFFGELETSKLSLNFLKSLWKQDRQEGVLSCNNFSVQKALVCLGLLKRIGDTRLTVKILKISGTLKKLGRIQTLSTSPSERVEMRADNYL